MAKQRLNHDDAFKNIMGTTAALEPVEPIESESEQPSRSRSRTPPVSKESKDKKDTKEKLVQTAFYITEKQRKALKIKAALGTEPQDKDLSSIVRAALDIYLSDTLKTIK